MTKSITITLLMVLSVTAGILADDIADKDIVEQGRILTVDGVFEVEDGEHGEHGEHSELYLKTDDTTYTVHLGQEWYTEQIGFPKKSGASATIRGFVVAEHIAPLTIVVQGRTYVFRDENGAPAWAGRGNRDNARDPSDCDDEVGDH